MSSIKNVAKCEKCKSVVSYYVDGIGAVHNLMYYAFDKWVGNQEWVIKYVCSDCMSDAVRREMKETGFKENENI